ncbi:ATP-dependent endonuclease [Listeria monocytogenes]|uniref:AAA family ATPase n=1 Tax=Listeria monocytogenes TaxID=1639 RepID=UPI001EDDB2D6|nr:AAA family ATPase [Listeria monocytogenes]MCG3315198.1 ATP-dependent endonuclease [Listeria monocytogenes]MCH5071784.1 ATP-dependent endonuclease [Listeria monocytogenes]
MELHSLHIKGYRRHFDTKIDLSKATFLIGENNTGKSSILKAIELFLNDNKTIDKDDFFKCIEDETVHKCSEVVLTGEIRNLPEDANGWPGFRGRLFPYNITKNGKKESGYSIFYRKTFSLEGKKRDIEMKARKKELKENISVLKNVKDLVAQGFPKELLDNSEFKIDDALNKTKLNKLCEEFEYAYDFYDYLEEEEWVKNPGGYSSKVLGKLPEVLYIPAADGAEDLSDGKGSFNKILHELFAEVRDASDSFKLAQQHLEKLAKEMNPEDQNTEFGKMMSELNSVLGGVFLGIGLNAAATLTDPNTAIKPTFDITMSSNVDTPIHMQGTGVVRSAVFGLLRYKALRDKKKKTYKRPLIICFEEPEIYLHPNAANQMRDTIYTLANTENNQIICSTHSPYMIDLGKKTGQVLNYLNSEDKDIKINDVSSTCETITNTPFNIGEAFLSLMEEDRDYVKVTLKMDDYISRIFFAKKVLIVEGDTEELVIRESINLLDEKWKKNALSNWQIIRARGKPVIISLIKYLKSMGIEPYVMHDLDLHKEGASKFNIPIKEALNNDEKLIRLENCIEDILGYAPPSKDKPFQAFKFIEENWKNDFNNIHEQWKLILEKLFKC